MTADVRRCLLLCEVLSCSYGDVVVVVVVVVVV